jgi:hypothetical protein
MAGRLEMELLISRVHDAAELWQVVFAPIPDTGTHARLRRLLEGGQSGLLAVLGTSTTLAALCA